MRHTLKRPALILIGIVPLLAVGFLAYKAVGSGFMPHEDEGGFVLDYISPPGTSLAETDRMLRQVEDDHPRQQERAHLLAAHRGAVGRWRDRGEHRRLLHPAEAVSARPDRRRDAAGHRQGQGAGADARHRHGPADGGPDRRPDRGAAADPGQDLQRRPGAARRPGAEGDRRTGQGQGSGRAAERRDPGGRRAEHRDRPYEGGRARVQRQRPDDAARWLSGGQRRDADPEGAQDRRRPGVGAARHTREHHAPRAPVVALAVRDRCSRCTRSQTSWSRTASQRSRART